MADRRLWIILASVFLGLFIIGAVLQAADAPEGVYWSLMAPLSFTLFNPLFWIIILVIFLVNRNKGQQQQQQQIVVVTGTQAGAGGPQLRCPGCQGLNPHAAVFCGHCGRSFAKKQP